MNYKLEIAKARERIRALDSSGASSHEDEAPLGVVIAAVMIALASAIRTRNWEVVAEAQVMLQTLHYRVAPPGIHRDLVSLLEE